jgi:O-antigen/teichoic acid export membrane protein
MSEPSPPAGQGRENRVIARGAIINGLGMLGKALMPVFYILAIRLYGPAVTGLYYGAFVVTEVAVSLSISGFNSGVIMFASRALETDEGADTLYRVIANGLVVGLGISVLFIALTWLGADTILPRIWPRPGYVAALKILALSLPFTVIPVLVASASKALLTMSWDALITGLLPPVSLSLFVGGFYLVDASLDGLLWAHFFAQVAVTVVSLVIFGRLFSFGRLLSALRHFRPFGALFAFAIPQNLNMTFNNLVTNVDVMMLAAFNLRPELVMFYGMGSQIARNVKQARISFSGAFEPVVARFHARGDHDGLSRSFSLVSRWATLVGLPLALVCAIFSQDLILLFHGSFTGDRTFILILLLPQVLSCSVGVAGNIVVMTGHSLWNLFNSVVGAGLNLLLAWLLIPRLGLNGAALSLALTVVVMAGLQLAEAKLLVGARLDVRRLVTPYLAILLPIALTVGSHLVGLDRHLVGRLATGVVALGTFAGVLLLLGLDEDDRLLWSRGRATAAPQP